MPKETIESLNEIIEVQNIDFLHAQPDVALEFVSKNRNALKCKTFLPREETVEICQDKYHTYNKWKKAGIKVPETIKIASESELEQALNKIPHAWFRKSKGAFGKGSIPLDNSKEAIDLGKAWMKYWGSDGNFILSERLDPNKTITWSAIFKDGQLIVAQTRERLSWEFGNRTVSGVTGLTGVAKTVSDKSFDVLAEKAIFAIDSNPNGIFSLDCTYDANKLPNPTEINIGRFFTTIDFFTKAGLNMPYIFVKTAYNEPIEDIARVWINYPKKINPIPDGYYWIRGMDIEPKLIKGEI
jgi:carbamoyl-phosphate synthase large subunit